MLYFSIFSLHFFRSDKLNVWYLVNNSQEKRLLKQKCSGRCEENTFFSFLATTFKYNSSCVDKWTLVFRQTFFYTSTLLETPFFVAQSVSKLAIFGASFFWWCNLSRHENCVLGTIFSVLSRGDNRVFLRFWIFLFLCLKWVKSAT